ncbi:MAG: DUF368 domain-containing protein [Myxococcales bacterium]|nr:DUF368 domain-containing protein [Myxococcales bacterium]
MNHPAKDTSAAAAASPAELLAESPDPPASKASAAAPSAAAVRDIAWSEAPYVVASGFCMGTADVVPGVSGGTMAVALGIYQQLLAAIASFDVAAVRSLLGLKLGAALARVHLRFLGALGLGIALGVGLMVKVVGLPTLVQEQPKLVYSVFFGLVLGSTVVLSRRMGNFGARAGLALALGAAVGFAVVNLVPVATPETASFVFFSGTVAICAMLLPGISGSFILLILGKYAYVLDALGRFDLGIILPFAAGCAVGVVAFSRVVGWALSRWHDTALAALTGLLVGSLWRIWPYQELTIVVVREKPRVIGAEPFWPQNFEVSVLGLCLAGLAAVLLLERYARSRAA